ncbi:MULTISPECIES: metallopeptidase family protein [Tsukamurella]|uniref:metallopeptidase family protein n=1 Tax=Tsukamurella TaxID=2060 RepID=UPI001CCD4656|nr:MULTISPECIES: metallopeptidase family protein [Tsukamurella]MCA0159084.1 metallopeptidase family protein [Tsukamurella sp. M9C]MCS3781568.1 putative Zn-dependent protease with MMP-like domain [Tsukamurella ocularis]MCS3787940.1 putative Zn-dependent protease with MMP-like domain [Tsukamurella ocularis]MCS3851235.1 putative Zn-dependent protease with MMP-like domain [Tsukamurella ocularis]
MHVSRRAFQEWVSDALDDVPPELAKAMDNVVVLVRDRNEDEPTLLGLYEGIALTERDWNYVGTLPDTITIYREALMDICDTEEQLRHEIRVTVLHEIGHHFGIDDHRLHDLGWA